MKMIVEINRLEEDFDCGTFSKMRMQKEVFADILEPADRENKRNISSIPAGQYDCVRHTSPKYGEVFKVMNVEDRDEILFHWGNISKNTKGCFLLGNGIGTIYGKRGVLNSKKTFKEFMRRLDHVDEFHLTITESY